MQTPLKSEPLYRRWTFTDELILLQNWDGSKSIYKIAKILNVEPNRVLEKAHQLRLDDRGINGKWSDSEISYLESIAETDTLDGITKKMYMRLRQEKKEKWKARTKKAIKKKLLELEYSAKPLVGYINLTNLARYLGRTYRYMQTLVEEGNLEVHRVGTNYIYVKEKSFIDFAKKYPFEVGEKMIQEGMIWFLQILGDIEK